MIVVHYLRLPKLSVYLSGFLAVGIWVVSVVALVVVVSRITMNRLVPCPGDECRNFS